MLTLAFSFGSHVNYKCTGFSLEGGGGGRVSSAGGIGTSEAPRFRSFFLLVLEPSLILGIGEKHVSVILFEAPRQCN